MIDEWIGSSYCLHQKKGKTHFAFSSSNRINNSSNLDSRLSNSAHLILRKPITGRRTGAPMAWFGHDQISPECYIDIHWQYMLIDLFISNKNKIFSSFEPTLVDVTSTNFGLQQRFCRVQGVRAVLSAWKRPNENGEGFSDIVDKPLIIYL